jgi:hypothetical protein
MTATLRALGLALHVGTDAVPGVAAGSIPGAQDDVRVAMLGEAPWPREVDALSVRPTYTSPDTDDHGTPIVSVFQHGDAFHRLRYWDASEFLVDRAGTRVWARWPAAVPAGEVEMCLLGPILGFLLHLRGTPCLHGSAVAVDGRAVAFLGHSGAGKSTTAAAFVRAGYPALTDDVLALDEQESRSPEGLRYEEGAQGRSPEGLRYLARPGHNLIRLWPDAVRALYGAEDALPRGADEKHHLDLATGQGSGIGEQGSGHRFHPAPLPLGAIYVLAARDPRLDRPAAITPLKGHAALMALVARTYMNYVLDAGLRARAFDQFSRLAASVPVRQLTVRHDAGGLTELTGAILLDLRQSTKST